MRTESKIDNYNTASMLFDNEGTALEEFYESNKDKHFWFKKQFITPTYTFSISEATYGHLWWKKLCKKCEFIKSNCSIVDRNVVNSFRKFLITQLPTGITVDVNVNMNYIRRSKHGMMCVYDYNIVNMYSTDTGKPYAIQDLIENCKTASLNPPYYEEGDFTARSLGEIFKNYVDFKNYVKECESMRYELVLCRAKEEIE